MPSQLTSFAAAVIGKFAQGSQELDG